MADEFYKEEFDNFIDPFFRAWHEKTELSYRERRNPEVRTRRVTKDFLNFLHLRKDFPLMGIEYFLGARDSHEDYCRSNGL